MLFHHQEKNPAKENERRFQEYEAKKLEIDRLIQEKQEELENLNFQTTPLHLLEQFQEEVKNFEKELGQELDLIDHQKKLIKKRNELKLPPGSIFVK